METLKDLTNEQLQAEIEARGGNVTWSQESTEPMAFATQDGRYPDNGSGRPTTEI